MTALDSGITIDVRICQSLAPSILALSSSSLGMFMKNGYSTAAITTTKTQILTVFSNAVSCSSQAGRSLPVPRTAPAPASITSTRLPGPFPARRACEGFASHGGSRVHPLLTHAMRQFVRTDYQDGAKDA